jgi:hypothetical protein
MAGHDVMDRRTPSTFRYKIDAAARFQAAARERQFADE